MNKQMTILVAGGSGLIGRRLSALLESKSFKVIRLSRGPSNPAKGSYHWNPENKEIDIEAIQQADVIINLAGESIAGKLWTPRRKRRIVNSRIMSTELLVDTLEKTPHHVQLVVNASAVGIYGDTGELIIHEESPVADDFLASTCRRWETAAAGFEKLGIRTVVFRIGIVLASEGGMLGEMKKIMFFRILPVFGSGKQYQSWIHIDDLCRMMAFVIREPETKGIFNAVSPGPLSNKNLMILLGQIAGGRFFRIRIPALFMRIMLGEMAKTVVTGTRVSCKKIESAGFKFTYASAGNAIRNILGK